MIYIGVDQSLTNFAACAVGDGDPKYLLVQSKLNGVQRLLDIYSVFTSWLESLDDQVGHTAMEGYASGARFGREMMGEIGATTKLVLVDFFGPKDPIGYPTIVAPIQVKAFVGCAGKKQEMLLAVYKKWGVDIRNDNLADAYVLARISEAMVRGGKLAYEENILAKLRGRNEWDQQKTPLKSSTRSKSGLTKRLSSG